MTPLVGKKLWFAPRGPGGWGWAPVAWQGWVALAAAVMTACALAARHASSWLPAVLIPGALLGICVLKGTRPGSGRSRDEYERTRDRPLVHGGGDPTPHLDEIVDNWNQRAPEAQKPSSLTPRQKG